MPIQPDLLAERVLNRMGFSGPYVDDPVIALYNIGRRLKFDPHWGPVLDNDVIGCNYRCAHCWVAEEALDAKLNSEFIQKKNRAKVASMRGAAIHSSEDIFRYLMKRSERDGLQMWAFTGGETTLYRGGISSVARLAMKEGVTVGADTNGWLIAKHDDYLDAWEGLQDTLHLYVSIKGTTPGEFERFTAVCGEHYEAPFVAVERLLRRGFEAIPGGVVTNTLATEAELKDNPNPITRLYDRLAMIHPDLPSLLSYHKVSTMVHDQRALSRKMRSRGYTNTKPGLIARELDSYFSSKGNPIVKEEPALLSKAELAKKIIQDLSV